MCFSLSFIDGVGREGGDYLLFCDAVESSEISQTFVSMCFFRICHVACFSPLCLKESLFAFLSILIAAYTFYPFAIYSYDYVHTSFFPPANLFLLRKAESQKDQEKFVALRSIDDHSTLF
jgi:hypothetical protein